MPDLTLDAVTKTYPSGSELVRALDSVSLQVAGGEIVALYGPSGSGKSTLLLVAAAMIAPDSGAVRFDGQDLSRLSANEIADHQRRVGFIFQDAHLMPGVRSLDNAALKLLADRVPLGVAREATAPWLDRVGLAGRLDHTPAQLSGGERQRVALARALVNDPQLILADEPTGNLDTRRGSEVLELIQGVCRERGVPGIIVTHDPQAATIADRVLDLRDGRLSADETPAAEGERPGRSRLTAG